MAEAPASSNSKDNEDQEDLEVDDEQAKRLEEEKAQAVQLGSEARRKAMDKQELQQTNKKAGPLRLASEQMRKLDSSVKKNSTFVRKLRSLTEQQRSSLTSELKGLNLTKYIEEVAVSIAEAKLKLADVGCAVHLSSELHQRYKEFSGHLFDHLQKIYSTGIGKDDDKSTVTSKYRIGLRLLGELVLAGVVDEGLGLSLLSDMLSSIIKADSKGHSYLAVIVSFTRHCGEDLAGMAPRKQRLLLTKYGIKPPKSELIPAVKQREFLELFRKYFNAVRDYLVVEHKAMHKRERRNRDIIFSRGEISEERQTENEAAQKAYDKLLTNTSTLAEVLDEDMPDLPEYRAPEDSDISIELQFPSAGGEGLEADPNSLWEDEDARSFYENITDITPFVPAILFEGRKKKSAEFPGESSDSPSSSSEPVPASGEEPVPANAEESDGAEPAEEQDENELLEQMIKDTEALALEEDMSVPEDPEEETGGSVQGAESSSGALLDEYLLRLPRLMNRKFVDDFAVEFCMSLNTKLNRRKLAKALFSVEKNRMDLIPFYARLAATLHQCLDDITPLLLEMLIKDFRFQVYKKDQVRIDFKLKNVRFIAELAKFGMCPKNEAMKCITILLHNFTHHHLEMACLFIEHCGRFLLRSPDSHLRAKALLQIMIRKKQVQHLDARQVRLVENALYYANPPETPQITHERLPPMHEYIRKLLYKDLTKVNTEKILRQIRKLPWGDGEVYQWAVTGLTQIWNVKYNNVHCMANLVAGLKPYQEDACVRVVDGVLENIRVGLELNLPKLNQARVSTLKYLGELYNYQLIESNVIFRTLYLILSFGTNPDGSPSLIDPHGSYFRVRLICLLLDTCGVYFDRGSAKKRLDAFLVFFQCYLFSKRQPLPLEVEHLVADCFEMLRPDLVMYPTPQEAHEAALALEAKFKDKVGHSTDMEEEPEEEEEDRGGGGRGQSEAEEDDEEERDDHDEDGDDEPTNVDSTNMFEDEAVLTEGPKLVACHEDDDFMATLDKLMADDGLPGSVKGGTVDAAIPLHLKGGGATIKTAPLLHEGGELKMAFKLMTKKGHKQQLKGINIPIDSGLAAGLMDSKESRQDEHKQMKELVLNWERKQEEEAYQAMIAETAAKFGKVKYVKRPAEPFTVKKPPSSPSTRAQQPPQSASTQREGTQREYRGDQRNDSRGGDHRYRGEGRGRGRGRGRGGGGRGGGQRNWHDHKPREQDHQER